MARPQSISLDERLKRGAPWSSGPLRQSQLETNFESRNIHSSGDDRRLAEMGYKPVLTRRFGLISCVAVGYSISNSWLAVTGALIVGIGNGGSLVYVWGSWLMLLIHLAIGASLGELSSAYPNAGGQYYWVMELAPEKCKRFLSFITGVSAWAGAMVTGASVSLLISQSVIGIILLTHPHITFQAWHAFLGYQLVNLATMIFNCYSQILPFLTSSSLYISLFSFITITVSILTVSPTMASASEVFGLAGYTNASGWSSHAINVFTGLLGVNWGFSCLDACTHMAEEIPQPERNIPKAIMGTVIIGFITSWVYSIAIFFVIQDVNAVISTPTKVPSLEVFRQALGGRIWGACLLQGLVTLCAIACVITVHTWQCRLAWSFSRDNGFPFSQYLAKVGTPPHDVPIYAHLFSTFWIAILGFLYLGSTTAFNSLITGGILLQYISYVIPVALLMIRKRSFETLSGQRGWFWVSGVWGWICNSVLVIWGSFACVVYSFPFVYPVTAGNMNYVSVVICFIFLSAVIYWVLTGRKIFKGAV